MLPARSEAVAVAIMAKAPVPGEANTRLMPALAADAAARLQARFIERTVATALAAAVGPVTLWASPDDTHSLFRALARRASLTLACQPEGDLGARMSAAIAARSPVLVIGVDCPALTADHLRMAARVLREGLDAVLMPADDGGYVLIGLRRPQPHLFAGVSWSTDTVMAETRRRLARSGLSWREPGWLWDIDVPADLERMRKAGFAELLDPPGDIAEIAGISAA